MRYIRTKDELGIEREDGTCCFKTWIAYFNSSLKEDWLYADTIEELCDGFWWEDDFYKDPIFMPNHYIVLERVKAWEDSDKELLTNEFARISIYASIYVKGKGWVHVAKMNDKGEFELL